MVQESEGPVAGLVSQNCTCWKSPPGLLMQQVSVEEPEQERTEVSLGQVTGVLARARGRMAARAAILENEDMLKLKLEAGKTLKS